LLFNGPCMPHLTRGPTSRSSWAPSNRPERGPSGRKCRPVPAARFPSKLTRRGVVQDRRGATAPLGKANFRADSDPPGANYVRRRLHGISFRPASVSATGTATPAVALSNYIEPRFKPLRSAKWTGTPARARRFSLQQLRGKRATTRRANQVQARSGRVSFRSLRGKPMAPECGY